MLSTILVVLLQLQNPPQSPPWTEILGVSEPTFAGPLLNPDDEHDLTSEAIAVTPDGECVIAGRTGKGRGGTVLLKLRPDGSVALRRMYPGGGEPRAVTVTSDGGYLLAGSHAHNQTRWRDGYLLKLDAGGNPLWSRCYGGARDDEFFAVHALAGGDAVAVGVTNSYGSWYDAWAIRVGQDGSIRWSLALGGRGYDGWKHIFADPAGLLLAGTAYPSQEEGPKAFMASVNNVGMVDWQYAYGGASVGCCGLVPDGLGGCVAFGTGTLADGTSVPYAFQVSRQGAMGWQYGYRPKFPVHPTSATKVGDRFFLAFDSRWRRANLRQDSDVGILQFSSVGACEGTLSRSIAGIQFSPRIAAWGSDHVAMIAHQNLLRNHAKDILADRTLISTIPTAAVTPLDLGFGRAELRFPSVHDASTPPLDVPVGMEDLPLIITPLTP